MRLALRLFASLHLSSRRFQDVFTFGVSTKFLRGLNRNNKMARRVCALTRLARACARRKDALLRLFDMEGAIVVTNEHLYLGDDISQKGPLFVFKMMTN